MLRTKLEFKLHWSLLKEFLELYSKTQFRTRLGSCQGDPHLVTVSQLDGRVMTLMGVIKSKIGNSGVFFYQKQG